jgi:RNase P subunit RPR2
MLVYGIKCKTKDCDNIFAIGEVNRDRAEWVKPFTPREDTCLICGQTHRYEYSDIGKYLVPDNPPA